MPKMDSLCQQDLDEEFPTRIKFQSASTKKGWSKFAIIFAIGFLVVEVLTLTEASTFDGDEWSSWSEWSQCTRTCDGGVTQQVRRCKSPNGCHGVSIRRKMCNMQPCADVRDYRDEQCKVYNGIDFKGRRRTWESVEDLSNPCALTCRVVGSDIIAKLQPKLRDGTRCKAGALHICIDGRCEAVGCDLKLGSPKKVDECGVCGGDGSTCSTPVYRWDVIPTTHCSATCGGGQQGVKVICRNSLTGEKVDSMLCNSEMKPYRLFRVCGNDPCPPAWTVGEWSDCSKTCGGGLMIRKVSCVQVKNGSEIQVADKLCDEDLRPINQEPCSMEPCPHWHAGPWSACSTTCGPQGTKTRNVVCRNSDNIPASNCDPRLLPPSKRACTEEESPPCPTSPPPPTTTTQAPSSTTTAPSLVEEGGEPVGPPEVPTGPEAETVVPNKASPENIVQPIPSFIYPSYDDDEDGPPTEYALPLMQPYPPKSFVLESNTEPTFVADKWSACSATCGEGVRRREVKCKIFLEFSRTIANLPDKDCPGPKPHDVEACFQDPCPPPADEWTRSSGSASALYDFSPSDGDSISHTSNNRKTITVGLPPGISHQDMTFSWKVMGYTPCSASCLGGVQEVMIHCVRDYDQRIATPVLCFDKPQPDVATTRTCNDHPCPPRWNVSEFGACSKSCGSGVMAREVNCIHEVTRGNTVVVPNSICPQPMPRTEKLCNTVNCPPYWEPGEFDKCSAPCGGGMRRRPIYCKQVIALGHVVEWSDSQGHCDGPKPADTRACNTQPCGRAKPEKQKDKETVSNGDRSTSTISSYAGGRLHHFMQDEWKKKLTLSVKGQATVFQGVALKLKCPTGSAKAVGGAQIDKSKIVWMKDHLFMGIQGNKIQMVPKAGLLKIRNATFSDSGVYTCLINDKPISNLTLMVQPYTGPMKELTTHRSRSKPYEEDRRYYGSDREPVTRSRGRGENQRGGQDPDRPWLHDQQLISWPFPRFQPHDINDLDEKALTELPPPKNFDDGNQVLPQPPSWKFEEEEVHELDLGNLIDCQQQQGRRGRRNGCQSEILKETPEWVVGNWSECTEDQCFTWNTAKRFRSVTCQFSNGSEPAEESCSGHGKPEQVEECYNPMCQGLWQTEPWSFCKARCGSIGIKMRIIKCVWFGSLQPAGNACAQLARPTVKKACLGKPCQQLHHHDEDPELPTQRPIHRLRHHRHGHSSSRHHHQPEEEQHNHSDENNNTNNNLLVSSSSSSTATSTVSKSSTLISEVEETTTTDGETTPGEASTSSSSSPSSVANYSSIDFYKNHFLKLQYESGFVRTQIFEDIIDFFQLYQSAAADGQGFWDAESH